MNAQPQLDFTRYPDRAGYKAPGTSQDAANAIEGSGQASRLRTAVLAFYGRQEGTPDQCAEFLQESPWSIRPRCSELLKKGELALTGRRGISSNGNPQNVLQLTSKPVEQSA